MFAVSQFCSGGVSSDQTSVWFPSDETEAEPEAPPVERTDRNPRHIFVSKTVRTSGENVCLLSGCSVSFDWEMKRVQSATCFPTDPTDPPGDPSRDLHAVREKDPLRKDRNEVQELPRGHSPRVQTRSHHQLLYRRCNSAGASGEQIEADGLFPNAACSS